MVLDLLSLLLLQQAATLQAGFTLPQEDLFIVYAPPGGMQGLLAIAINRCTNNLAHQHSICKQLMTGSRCILRVWFQLDRGRRSTLGGGEKAGRSPPQPRPYPRLLLWRSSNFLVRGLGV